MTWHVYAAAITGTSHAEIGTPCQDAFAHRVVGEVLCAAVCDGAGSAPLSHLGAQTVATHVAQGMARDIVFGSPLHTLAHEAAFECISKVVASARQVLQSHALASSAQLADYAATLVAAVVGPSGGWLIHVGDGVGAAQPREGDRPAVVSAPENGEYANETYFITGEHWREHLRLTPVATPLRSVLLMSDGAAPFVMTRGHTDLSRPFVEPVERFLSTASTDVGNRALATTLDDPRTHSITNDDKTLLVAQWRGA